MPADVLDDRALNRATLARQLLLARGPAPVDAVEHLVGLQAQVPHNPYSPCGRASTGSSPTELAQLLARPGARAHRGDAGHDPPRHGRRRLLLRPLVQPVLDGELARHREYDAALAGVDLAPVAGLRRARCSPSGRAPAPSCGARWPSASPTSTPPRSPTPAATAWRWCRCRRGASGGARRQVRSTTAEAWLGRPLATEPVDRRRGAALPRGLRPGDGGRRRRVVAADRAAARCVERLRPRAAAVPRRAGPRAARPARRAPARPRHAGPGPVPARVRQRAAVPRRPHPVPCAPSTGGQSGCSPARDR